MYEMLAVARSQIALLPVDFQEEHRADPDFLAADYQAALNNAASLLAAARKAGVFIAHAAYVCDFDKEPPRPFEVVSDTGRPAFSGAAGGLVAICPEVSPQGAELVLIKQDASAFRNTGLDGVLRRHGIEWLIVAGGWTEACVAATVRDAMARGFHVLLVKDACASGTRHMHQVGILNLANRLLGGAVASTEAAAQILRGEAARVWRFTRMVPFRFTARQRGLFLFSTGRHSGGTGGRRKGRCRSGPPPSST